MRTCDKLTLQIGVVVLIDTDEQEIQHPEEILLLHDIPDTTEMSKEFRPFSPASGNCNRWKAARGTSDRLITEQGIQDARHLMLLDNIRGG